MRDYYAIGSTPFDEDCAQLGHTNDYEKMNSLECKVYRDQILREHGALKHCTLEIKTFSHDFGNYKEVCVTFDIDNEDAIEEAEKYEGGCMVWDAIALETLKAESYSIKN